MADEDNPFGRSNSKPADKFSRFVSEKTLEEERESGPDNLKASSLPPDEGRSGPLWEILKGDKEAKDKEFEERFKNLPPKALDNDEVEFLEAKERERRELEMEQADRERLELQKFRRAVANHVHSVTIPPPESPRQLTNSLAAHIPPVSLIHQSTLLSSKNVHVVPKRKKSKDSASLKDAANHVRDLGRDHASLEQVVPPTPKKDDENDRTSKKSRTEAFALLASYGSDEES